MPPGRYALQAHPDRNGDGLVGRNMIGVPTEGVGFSRDPSMLFGPPSFEAAAVEVTPAPARVKVELRFGGSS